MRKYNEGYTLVFVMVVLLVIGLLATAILSFSVQNLKNQHASIDRMTAEYEAAARIEKYAAKLEHAIEEKRNNPNPATDDDNAVISYNFNLLENELTNDDPELKVEFRDVSIKLTSQSGSVGIECEIFFVASDAVRIQNGYTLTNCTDIRIGAYTISSNAVSGEEVAPE